MQDSGQDSGQGREMSDKTNVDALTSAFGNGMSLDGGEQGGEPSPDTPTDNFLNQLNNLQAPPEGVAASAEQLAAAEQRAGQAVRLTARQLDVYMNNNTTNNTTNKRSPPSDGSSDGSDDSDSDFDQMKVHRKSMNGMSVIEPVVMRRPV
eukprot:COSAG06_NODE_10462_length_1678_cov_1.974668_1_plen_149_part_10